MGKDKDVRIIYNQGCPEWMLTFGDCMSLLLCFFVMLMTFSTPDESKLMVFIGGLQGALGSVEPPIMVAKRMTLLKPVGEADIDGNIVRGESVQYRLDAEDLSPISLREVKIKNKFTAFQEELYDIGFKKAVTIHQVSEGLAMDMNTDILFAPNSDELKPGASKWMAPLASLLESMGNEARLTLRILPGESISLARKRLDTLCAAMTGRYKVKPSRISIGIEFASEGAPMLRTLVADKLLTKELSMADFLSAGGK